MSGQGNPPQQAPGRTIGSLLLSEPAIAPGGYLTTWFAQFLTRLSALVGPASGDGTTVTNQVNSLTQALLRALGGQGIDGASLALLNDLEGAPEALLPPLPDAAALAPLQSLEPWLTSDDIVTTPTLIYAPLVNGDLPGPTLIADPYGQCIMVPVT